MGVLFLKLTIEKFVKKSEKLNIDYEKYVNINGFGVKELAKNENFIKKETVLTGAKFKKIGDNPSKEQNVEDTYYYFKEGEYIVVLIDHFSNFEYHDKEDFQERMGEIKAFIIQK